jgi:BolA protein
MAALTAAQLEEQLRAGVREAQVDVLDESGAHAGHAGSAGGGGHFRVRIVSSAFIGMGKVARHRLVYDQVRAWMPDQIHALSIEAMTPEEAG